MPAATPHPLRLETPAADQPEARAALCHERLAEMPAALFQFDPRMASGWLSDRYFLRTARTLAMAGRDPIVRMQVFAKKPGILAGVYEAIRMLQTQLAATNRSGAVDFRALSIDTLVDGDAIEPREPVMHVTGPYLAFAHLETTLLGVLARRTLVASNARRAIEAAGGKPIIFMAARHDDWRVQTPDGYAAAVGGAGSVSSDAGGAWWGSEGVGTMPHAMIAGFGGDVVDATLAFARYVQQHERGVKVVSLTDYRNDVVGDSLAVARAMEEHFGRGALHAVRIDTSETLVDRSLEGREADFPGQRLAGVSLPLVTELRGQLDTAGFPHVGIIVSGGFTPTKIRQFEAAGAAVIAYGIGSSLLGHNQGDADGLVNNFDFTADIVMVDGRAESKVGRERRDNPRFVTLDAGRLFALDAARATARAPVGAAF